jgi:glycosyltransferase involved in cell wall biosynthesis
MIVQLVNPAVMGGLEGVVALLLRALHEAGEPVALLAVLDEGQAVGPLVTDAEQGGVPVRRVVVPPRRYGREQRAVRAALRALRATVVHSHGARMDVMAAWATRAVGVPWVSTLHGFTGGDLKNRGFEALQRWVLRGAQGVVAVSPPLAARAVASGMDAARVHTLPNAIAPVAPWSRAEARARLGVPAHATVVGWVGRLGHEKDPALFVEVVRALVREAPPGRPPVHGLLVGDGPQRAAVAAQGAALVAAGRLTLAGAQPEAARLMRAMDVLVNTSHTEGTPLTVLDAMQLEVPVVATAVGGVPALLAGRGVVVAERSASVVAQAVAALLADVPRGAALVAAARAHVAAHHAPTPWRAAHQALYTRVRATPGADARGAHARGGRARSDHAPGGAA